MMNDFRNRLNFEKKTVVFIEKEYTLKTDHKTGLLLQELQKKVQEDEAADLNERMIKLVLGEKQANELFEELEKAGQEKGAENYTENIVAITFGIMSVLYNKPYENFEEAFRNANSKK